MSSRFEAIDAQDETVVDKIKRRSRVMKISSGPVEHSTEKF